MAIIWRRKADQISDDNGNPLAGGLLTYFDAGTTNPKTVYRDAAETALTAWGTSVTLDSAGRPTDDIYVSSGAFKETRANSSGGSAITSDNIPGATAIVTSTFARPQRPIITKAANYTITVADLGALFVVDQTGGDVTLSLPAAVLCASGTGVGVVAVGTSNSVIIDGNGAETVGGAANFAIKRRLGAVEVTSDGASSWALEGADYVAGVTLASATTVDLGSAATDLVAISGTTTITGFGTAPAGIGRWVRFTGALTLTYNATSLILPTSASITTAAGDTAHFKSEGSGNWRCHSYLRASGLPFGLVVGTDVQAYDADLTALAGLTPSGNANSFIASNGTDWVRVDPTTARSALGIVTYDLYTGSTAANTSYPIGDVLFILADAADVDMNASAVPRVWGSDASIHLTSGAGAAMSGTWRCRGRDPTTSLCVMRRTA